MSTELIGVLFHLIFLNGALMSGLLNVYYTTGAACGISGLILSFFNTWREIKRSKADGVYTRHLQRELGCIEEALDTLREDLFQISNLSMEEFSNRSEKVLKVIERFGYCNVRIPEILDYCSVICPVKGKKNESWSGLMDYLDPLANELNYLEKDDLKIGDFQKRVRNCESFINKFKMKLHSFMGKHVK